MRRSQRKTRERAARFGAPRIERIAPRIESCSENATVKRTPARARARTRVRRFIQRAPRRGRRRAAQTRPLLPVARGPPSVRQPRPESAPQCRPGAQRSATTEIKKRSQEKTPHARPIVGRHRPSQTTSAQCLRAAGRETRGAARRPRRPARAPFLGTPRRSCCARHTRSNERDNAAPTSSVVAHAMCVGCCDVSCPMLG